MLVDVFLGRNQYAYVGKLQAFIEQATNAALRATETMAPRRYISLCVQANAVYKNKNLVVCICSESAQNLSLKQQLAYR